MADVGFIFQNAFDLRYRPCVAFFLWCASVDIGESPVTLEIDKSRRRYFFRNQYPCNAGRPFAVNSKVKNLLHDPAGFLVDYQLVLDFRVLLVPEGSIGADTLSGGKLCLESSLYLTAGVLCEPFVEQVFEWHKIGQSLFCVLVLRNGDVPHPFFREQKFQIVVHHHMLPPETGQVFGDNAVYFSGFHIIHHALETRTLEVCPTPSIVHIFPDHMKPLLPCVLLQDCPLRFNAYAVAIAFIVTAQPHIKSRVVNGSIVRLFHRKNPPSKETTHAYNTFALWQLYHKRGRVSTMGHEEAAFAAVCRTTSTIRSPIGRPPAAKCLEILIRFFPHTKYCVPFSSVMTCPVCIVSIMSLSLFTIQCPPYDYFSSCSLNFCS